MIAAWIFWSLWRTGNKINGWKLSEQSMCSAFRVRLSLLRNSVLIPEEDAWKASYVISVLIIALNMSVGWKPLQKSKIIIIILVFLSMEWKRGHGEWCWQKSLERWIKRRCVTSNGYFDRLDWKQDIKYFLALLAAVPQLVTEKWQCWIRQVDHTAFFPLTLFGNMVIKHVWNKNQQ